MHHPIISADSESLWENFTHYVHPRAPRRPTLYMILYNIYIYIYYICVCGNIKHVSVIVLLRNGNLMRWQGVSVDEL